MLNEIFPAIDGNFTVLGKYPYNLPDELRNLLSSNHEKHFVLVKVKSGFIFRFFDQRDSAELAIKYLQPGSVAWLVNPTSKAETGSGTISVAQVLQS